MLGQSQIQSIPRGVCDKFNQLNNCQNLKKGYFYYGASKNEAEWVFVSGLNNLTHSGSTILIMSQQFNNNLVLVFGLLFFKK